MVQYNTFNHKNHKINELYQDAQYLKSQVPELTKPEPVEYSVTYLKKNQIIEVPTTPDYYDMYNWLGTTYSSGGIPEPESAYEEGFRGYYFRYPTTDFRVPKGSTPMDEVPGTTEEQWEYVESVGIIKSSVFIKNLDEKLLNYTQVKSFLYNQNNEAVGNNDFSEIYRWHKENSGYTLHYNAFFTVVEEESQLLVKTELILMNPNNFDAIYLNKLV